MNNKLLSRLASVVFCLYVAACSVPANMQKDVTIKVPDSFGDSKDSSTAAVIKWRDFFKDENLAVLIDSALKNNQELNITLQEINIAKNDIRFRKAAYLPFIGIGGAAGIDKSGLYTSKGASDASNQVMPGKSFPDPLPDYLVGVNLSWEVDIWKKLRNSKNAAVNRYLASVEGKNFMVTHLIAEIAASYYELLALDNQLDILRKNIAIQQNALEIVKLEKNSARVTELAVKKFEAEVLKNQSRQYEILQMITVTENRINFLVGRFPQPVKRTTGDFLNMRPDSLAAGVPAQLLKNRPDIRQTEQRLIASRLEVKAVRAEFYPSLTIRSGAGYNAFNPKYLINTPQSLIYMLAGDLMAPLINRNAIKAEYYSANARQVQAVYDYERTLLSACIEVSNQLLGITNLKKNYELKEKQVEALNASIDISTILFRSARADYMEVLMTQRDALDARFELIDTRKQQFMAMINLYRALGGGWR